MEPSIALAPGAEENTVATWVATVIEENLQQQHKLRRDFLAMRAAVAMVAPDRRLAATLRFDLGQLTIHDGMIGVPDVTLCADLEVLRSLSEIHISRWLRLPLPGLSPRGRRNVTWRRTALEVLSGELRIYGLLAHPRLIVRLLRLLSQPRNPNQQV